jgi:hypothetical protein
MSNLQPPGPNKIKLNLALSFIETNSQVLVTQIINWFSL